MLQKSVGQTMEHTGYNRTETVSNRTARCPRWLHVLTPEFSTSAEASSHPAAMSLQVWRSFARTPAVSHALGSVIQRQEHVKRAVFSYPQQGSMPFVGTAPLVGRSPNNPHQAAGLVTLPQAVRRYVSVDHGDEGLVTRKRRAVLSVPIAASRHG